MLVPIRAYISGVGTRHHANPQADIIAGADLINQPSYAMRIVSFMAGHDAPGFHDGSWVSYGAVEGAVLFLAVPIRDCAWVRGFFPRTLGALRGSLEFPLLTQLLDPP